MKQDYEYTIIAAIFDQESFEETLDNRVTVISQANVSWNYEKLTIETNMDELTFRKFLYKRFDGALDWDFIPEDEQPEQDISL